MSLIPNRDQRSLSDAMKRLPSLASTVLAAGTRLRRDDDAARKERK